MIRDIISSSLFSEMALRYNTRSLNRSRLPDDLADVLAFELLMGFNSSIKYSIRDSLFFSSLRSSVCADLNFLAFIKGIPSERSLRYSFLYSSIVI